MTRTTSGVKPLGTACLIGFCCFFASYLRMPVVPLLAASLGADAVQVGLINGVFLAMASILSIPSGLISDRLGRRRPLLGGCLLLAASSFLLFWSRTLPQMALAYLFFGIGMSTFSPALMAYVGDITPPQSRGRAFGWYTMAMYAGMTLGPAAGGFLAGAWGLRQVFPLAGAVIGVIFVVTFFFLPTPKEGPKESPLPLHTPPPAILDSLRTLMKNRELVGCLLVVLGSCVGYGTFVTFMPLYLQQEGMNTAHIGVVFAAGALTNTLARLPSGRLCDRFRDKGILVALGLIIFALALGGFAVCRRGPSFVAGAAVMGIGMGTAFTVICAMIADAVPRELRGVAVGCYNTCIYAGMLVSALGVGAIVRAAGFRAAFLLNGALQVAVLVTFRYLHRNAAGAAAQRTVGAECSAQGWRGESTPQPAYAKEDDA